MSKIKIYDDEEHTTSCLQHPEGWVTEPHCCPPKTCCYAPEDCELIVDEVDPEDLPDPQDDEETKKAKKKKRKDKVKDKVDKDQWDNKTPYIVNGAKLLEPIEKIK
jgi:hypothetical protein